MTCTVEITLHALSQRSPAESIGKGQKLIEAARPEGAEALSPGQRPGLSCSQTWRPVRAKALKLTLKFIKLLPLQGALLTVTIPRALPWAKSFCPFRACCLYGFQLLHPVLESHAKVLLLYFHKNGAVLNLSVKVPKDVPKANIMQTFAQ